MKTLCAQNLCKSYGGTKALRDVTLTLEPGHIYGLLGRNGAGKTTLLKAFTSNQLDAQLVIAICAVFFFYPALSFHRKHPAWRRRAGRFGLWPAAGGVRRRPSRRDVRTWRSLADDGR